MRVCYCIKLSRYAGAHYIGAFNLKALAKVMKLQQALPHKTVEFDVVNTDEP
jgi:hypothetical protein